MAGRFWVFVSAIFWGAMSVGMTVGFGDGSEPWPIVGIPMVAACVVAGLRTLLPSLRVVGDEVRVYHMGERVKRFPVSDIEAVSFSGYVPNWLPTIVPTLQLTKRNRLGGPEEVLITAAAVYPTPWGKRAVRRKGRRWAARIGVPLDLSPFDP